MQDYDWNDLRYVLALHLAGTLAGAGRVIGVNETTVARRLKILEGIFQASLFLRNNTSRYEATEVGLAVIERAEIIERENASISEMIGKLKSKLFGVVRITSVPIIANRILVPRLRGFREANPNLTIELVPDARNLSLSKREADIALRFARPETGGLRTKARKLGALAFAVYGPASISNEGVNNLDWIEYDEAHADLPQAQWLASAAGGRSTFPCLRVCDVETALEAVAAGLGKTILPRLIADVDRRLRRVQSAEFKSLPIRDVWLLAHSDQEKHRSIIAAKEWLASIDW